MVLKNGWSVTVDFIGEYADLFTIDERTEKAESENRFAMSILQIIEQTGIIPVVGDWIDPIDDEYLLDSAQIGDRGFDPNTKTINFSIE